VAPAASIETPSAEPSAADDAVTDGPAVAAVHRTKAAPGKRPGAKAGGGQSQPSSAQGGSFDPLQMRR
jgi:hypothetical protein